MVQLLNTVATAVIVAVTTTVGASSHVQSWLRSQPLSKCYCQVLAVTVAVPATVMVAITVTVVVTFAVTIKHRDIYPYAIT